MITLFGWTLARSDESTQYVEDLKRHAQKLQGSVDRKKRALGLAQSDLFTEQEKNRLLIEAANIRAERNKRYFTALQKISGQVTPGANATVRRMALIADAALYGKDTCDT